MVGLRFKVGIWEAGSDSGGLVNSSHLFERPVFTDVLRECNTTLDPTQKDI